MKFFQLCLWKSEMKDTTNIFCLRIYQKSLSRKGWSSSQHVSRPLPTNSLNLWKYGAASHLKTHSAQYTQLQQIQKYIPSHLFFATSDLEFVWQYGNIFGKSKYECVAAQQVVGSSFPWESLNGTSMGPLAKSWVVPSPENNSWFEQFWCISCHQLCQSCLSTTLNPFWENI